MLEDVETFDVPQEQIRRIKYALALEIAPEYELAAGIYDRLQQRYDRITASLEDFDREMTETYIIAGRR